MPKVTALMPAYDCAAYVQQAVASVLVQTEPDLELVVVDDGSQDDTADVVAAITDPRIRLLRRPHAGISATLNAGLAVARTPLIARLDADDLWEPHFLETMLAALAEWPLAGLAYARAGAIDLQGRPLAHTRGRPLYFPQDSFASMLVRDCTTNIAILMRRECVEQVGGFDERLTASEDWDLLLRISRVRPFVFVDEILARYRERPGSITRAPGVGPMRMRERLHVLERACESPELTSQARAAVPIASRNAYFDLGLAHWEEHEYSAAAHAFGRGIRESRSLLRATARLVYSLFLHHFGPPPGVERVRAAASRVRRQLISGT